MKALQAIARFRERLWSKEIFERCNRTWYRFWLLMIGRALYVVVDSLRRSDVQQRASALTMVTLISLVPALAVVFAILTAFTSLEDVAFIIKSFVLNILSVSEGQEIGLHLDR